MSEAEIFADDFKAEPYWWMAAPRPDEQAPERLPERADVVVVGSGFTGLSAALTLARGGRDVLVLDADVPGFGASSRNAGYVGKTLKHSFGSLLATFGADYAKRVYGEMQGAFDYTTGLVREEQISCHYKECGRFMAANSPAHYEGMARELELRRKHLGDLSEMVPASQQHLEFGSDLYCGGAVIPDLGGIHPGLYHLGLLERARNAQAQVIGNTPVQGIVPAGEGFRVHTSRGEVSARHVFVATNGYTRESTPWFQRRLVPFQGFMVATEELPEATLRRVFPNARTTHDYNNNLTYLRRAPDSNRILFGGLTGMQTDDGQKIAQRLQRKLAQVLPDLADVRISRAWNGYCAGTFDMWPHIGVHEGVHYALGYCFAGLPMGTYLGHKAALQILGDSAGKTLFSERELSGRWWYRGNPWFVPLYMAHMNWLDSRGK